MNKSTECKPHLLHEHELSIAANAPKRAQPGLYLYSYVAYSARQWMDHVSTYTDVVEPRRSVESPIVCEPHLRHSTAKIWCQDMEEMTFGVDQGDKVFISPSRSSAIASLLL